MRNLIVLFIHFLATLARLLGPDTRGCLTFQRLALAAVSGQPWDKLSKASFGV
jgi:hypothetical protein